MKITVMMYFDMHDELEVLVALKCYERNMQLSYDVA